jgi:PAS domain S-box-containing protein
VDVFNIVLQLAFILIFIVVLVRYLREPTVVHRDIVLVFACTVALFGIAIVLQVWPALPRGISQLSTTVLLLQPYLTLRLASHFVRVSRRTANAALAWFAASVVAVVIGTRGNPPFILFVVAYFVAIEAWAGLLLQRSSDERVGYARTRLRIAALATFLFAGGILFAGVGAALAARGATTDPSITFISRLMALAAGLGYLAAFLPPMALRRLQQRAVAFDLGQALLGSPVDGDPDSVWIALTHAARMITNGPVAAVALGARARIRVVDGEGPPELTVGAAYEPPAPTLFGELPDDTTFAVTIESDLGAQGWLVVHPADDSLFLEDDLVLLDLLATQAARANERREAIRERGELESELQDASQELAMSRAQLESEARFRVAMEAHPGILLVIEPDGTVGYANEQALRSLGYTAAENRRRSLADVLTRDPQATDEDIGNGEARRADGTTIPVDYAVSAFDSGVGRSSIAVLTDVSDRMESDYLRDTFIGILSHELRTPVTAIYGGSQVLLGRGERLDREVTRELVTDIAAEAERLHRLIENLLVLARVERGEDLVGGEPVLLQRVLPTIVERERALWLGTHISATVPTGLPTVRGHDGYVAQVIRNLLSNAVKYGGPEPTVEIVVEGGPEGVTVRVLDDGPGLESDSVDRLFDLYYRAPGSAVRAPGAGIGLFVCRRIVTALGGTIWARERPSGGAEFGFNLPVYEADEDIPAMPTGGGELAAAS